MTTTDARPVNKLTLPMLEALLQSDDAEGTLRNIEEYLEEYPEDTGALLVKAELLLRLERDYASISSLVSELEARLPDATPLAGLRARIDEVIRAKLLRARNAAMIDHTEALLQALADAVQLGDGDPGIAMAAALILMGDEREAFEISSLDEQSAQVIEYLRLASAWSRPDNDRSQQATRYLLRVMLGAGDTAAALALLKQTPDLSEMLGNRKDDFAQCIGFMACERATLLLKAGAATTASELLDLCIQLVPDTAIVRVLRAEAAFCLKQPAVARALYEAALAPRESVKSGSLEVAVPLLTLVTEAAITCPHCGKRTPASSSDCAYCGRDLLHYQLVMESYKFDNESEATIAQIGLALLLLHEGDKEAGLVHLDAAIAMITGDEARGQLEALRAQHVPAAPADDRLEGAALMTRWQQEGLSPDVLAGLGALGPDDWARLSESRRCALIRSALQTHDLSLARQLFTAAFRTGLHTKAAHSLSATIARHSRRAAEASFNEATEAFAAGNREAALAAVTDALNLVPDFAEARLLRGRLLEQAEKLLPALGDFEIVAASQTDAAADARLEAARLLENLGEYERALEYLHPADRQPEAHALQARLECRRQGEPFVRLLPVEDIVMHDTLQRAPGEQWAGLFAIVLRMTGRPMAAAAEGLAQHLMTASYEFVQAIGALRDSAGDPVFALRWISRPHSGIPERGELTLALLARVIDTDPAACQACALELWAALRPMLPGVQALVYDFEPVIDEAELDVLLHPFEPVSLAEIVRREETPDVRGSRYTVYPFMPGSISLHTLCWALLRQPGPAMLSIHLVPTSMQMWEEAGLDRIMLEQNDGSLDPDNAQVTYADPVSQWWQGAPQWGQAQANRYLADYLRAQAYVLRVNVATGPGTPSVLPEILASTLFGPLRPVNTALYGGYEVIRAATDDEYAIARRNLETVDVEGWVYSAAPASSRLRHLVSEAEAVLAFRLPLPGYEGIPGVEVIDAKPVMPPANLPLSGVRLGESVGRSGGMPLPIFQSIDDRRRHCYVVGKTGVGKSTLLKSLALQDIEAGHGVCVVDPHGDLIDDILPHIPAERAADVVVFDPSDSERPIGLNLLESRSETERHQIVTEFLGLLIRMYDPHQQGIVGPRFQHNVRNAMLTAMAVEGNTLIEVVRVLTDIKYVKKLLPHVTDPMIKNYWTHQIANTSDFHKSEILDYMVSKFSRFVGDSRVRNIVGQQRTTLDFRAIMDNRKILLVNLSKGKIGPENAQFLGLLVVQRLLLTALSRADSPPDARPDFFLYVDEFQNFATELFATVLSEGRKYGVAATVANQYITQFDRSVFEAISGNVGSLVSFRVGTQDALTLAAEMYPVFNQDDLLNLPKYTACVKLLTDGVAARPFTMRTRLDTRVADHARADEIRERSRQTYGRDAQTVTEEVLARFAQPEEPETPRLRSLLW